MKSDESIFIKRVINEHSTEKRNRIYASFQDEKQDDSIFKSIINGIPGYDEYNKLTTTLAHNRVVEKFGHNCKTHNGYYKTEEMSEYFMQMVSYYEHNLNMTGNEKSGVITLINMIISTFRENPGLADKIYP